MDLLNFIFRLGVLFAIYGFIWALIELGLGILSMGSNRTPLGVYLFRAIKYVVLVDVTVLFCYNLENNQIQLYNLGVAGLVLLTYFIGKLQNRQQQAVFLNAFGSGMPNIKNNFNIQAELAVIGLSFGFFVFLIFYPHYSNNPLSAWFHESILNIEDTPIFGFIFKIIGFFFLLNLLFKMLNGFVFLISGKPIFSKASRFGKPNKDNSDDFDDFEEIN
jgi:hypothetical protein